MDENEILSMSDEDFAKLAVPTKVETPDEQKPSEEKPDTSTVVPPVAEEEKATEVATTVVEEKPATSVPASTAVAAEVKTEPVEKQSTAATPAVEKPPTEENPDSFVGSIPKTPEDYVGFYQQIMKPFKANGKTIEVKTPDEAISLMKMGANYTRKMQDIAPHRNVLMMLQDNNLLDPQRLSFLIDLDKKNPQAIQKFIKESGIDPLDIDIKSEAQYQPGNHHVDDREVAFRTVLEDLKSSETGTKSLQEFNTWDQSSKEALWGNPEIMTIIHSQRETGVYDRISAEIDRRRTMGSIPANAPFLQAYKLVGDEMVAKNAFADLVVTTAQPAKPVPVATTVTAAKPAVANNAKAKAAASTRGSPTKVTPIVNPLAMSDEEFLTHMKKRV